jgi:hypothetical protein
MEGIHDGQYFHGTTLEYLDVGAYLFLVVLSDRALPQCRANGRSHRTERSHVPVHFNIHDVRIDIQLHDDCWNRTGRDWQQHCPTNVLALLDVQRVSDVRAIRQLKPILTESIVFLRARPNSPDSGFSCIVYLHSRISCLVCSQPA